MRKLYPSIPGLLTVSAPAIRLAWPSDEDSDAGSDSTSGTVGTGNDARLALMDRINDENDKLRADELADINDDETTSPFTLPEPGNDEEVVADSEGGNTDKVVAPVPKMKVDGVEVDITPELIAKAQKIANADKYLQEAAEARKPSTTVVEPEVVTPQKDAAQLEKEAHEEELALVRAIQVGTEEEAVTALRKIKASGQVNFQQMSRIADERLAFQSALTWFEGEYSDLVGNKQLHDIVLQRDAELVQGGDKRPYKERFEAVGKEVRMWRDELIKSAGAVIPNKEDPKKDDLEKKDAKKQALPSTPVAAGGKAQPKVDPDDGDEDPHDVIAKMAASRGGPQWSRGLPVA